MPGVTCVDIQQAASITSTWDKHPARTLASKMFHKTRPVLQLPHSVTMGRLPTLQTHSWRLGVSGGRLLGWVSWELLAGSGGWWLRIFEGLGGGVEDLTKARLVSISVCCQSSMPLRGGACRFEVHRIHRYHRLLKHLRPPHIGRHTASPPRNCGEATLHGQLPEAKPSKRDTHSVPAVPY